MNTTENRITLDEFIAQNNITADIASGAPEGSHRLDGDATMNDWTVTMRSWRRSAGALVVPFFTGLALNEPTAHDVLECLALDAATYENAGDSFEDWAAEYGLDTDSRKVERTWRAVAEQSIRLRNWLGAEEYELLLWNVDTD